MYDPPFFLRLGAWPPSGDSYACMPVEHRSDFKLVCALISLSVCWAALSVDSTAVTEEMCLVFQPFLLCELIWITCCMGTLI